MYQLATCQQIAQPNLRDPDVSKRTPKRYQRLCERPSKSRKRPFFRRIPRKRVLHPLPCLALIGVEFPLRGDPQKLETRQYFVAPGPYPAVPPSGGSLEIGNPPSPGCCCSPPSWLVPPSGGSLEIGNVRAIEDRDFDGVPPSGGSLEIGNGLKDFFHSKHITSVPPSGGSLEIGNENHIPFSPARMESTRTV